MECEFGIVLRVARKNRFVSHQEELMKIAFTSIAATAALAMALTALPTSVAGAQEQRRDDNVQQRQYDNDQQRQVQHPDYSRNRYYALGNREGYQDYGRQTQRATHHHSYRNDDDRVAHDYGYQQGYRGTRGYHPDTDRR
jgi:hypothetical protein